MTEKINTSLGKSFNLGNLEKFAASHPISAPTIARTQGDDGIIHDTLVSGKGAAEYPSGSATGVGNAMSVRLAATEGQYDLETVRFVNEQLNAFAESGKQSVVLDGRQFAVQVIKGSDPDKPAIQTNLGVSDVSGRSHFTSEGMAQVLGGSIIDISNYGQGRNINYARESAGGVGKVRTTPEDNAQLKLRVMAKILFPEIKDEAKRLQKLADLPTCMDSLGLSYGGLVSIHMLVKDHDLFGRVFLLDPHTPGDENERDPARAMGLAMMDAPYKMMQAAMWWAPRSSWEPFFAAFDPMRQAMHMQISLTYDVKAGSTPVVKDEVDHGNFILGIENNTLGALDRQIEDAIAKVPEAYRDRVHMVVVQDGATDKVTEDYDEKYPRMDRDEIAGIEHDMVSSNPFETIQYLLGERVGAEKAGAWYNEEITKWGGPELCAPLFPVLKQALANDEIAAAIYVGSAKQVSKQMFMYEKVFKAAFAELPAEQRPSKKDFMLNMMANVMKSMVFKVKDGEAEKEVKLFTDEQCLTNAKLIVDKYAEIHPDQF